MIHTKVYALMFADGVYMSQFRWSSVGRHHVSPLRTSSGREVHCLNNTQFYKELSDDPTKRISEEITLLLKEMREKEGIGERNFLLRPTSESQDIPVYFLPKIHKPGILGKPIVSSCGALTEKTI